MVVHVAPLAYSSRGIKKGFKEFFEKEDADIFCIQETKMQQDQIDDEIKSLFSKYNCYWNSAIRKGY